VLELGRLLEREPERGHRLRRLLPKRRLVLEQVLRRQARGQARLTVQAQRRLGQVLVLRRAVPAQR